MTREKTRIAMLIVVAIVAIALAMLEALAGESRTSAPATAVDAADIDAQGRS
jgi:hypothetical protein